MQLSASSIVNLILLDTVYADKDILSNIYRGCKASADDILSAVAGTDLNDYQKARIGIVKAHRNTLILF